MTDLRVLWTMLVLALAGALLVVLAPVLTPFLIAAVWLHHLHGGLLQRVAAKPACTIRRRT